MHSTELYARHLVVARQQDPEGKTKVDFAQVLISGGLRELGAASVDCKRDVGHLF
jgi:hypothetical protein